jgi:hypothetical protein
MDRDILFQRIFEPDFSAGQLKVSGSFIVAIFALRYSRLSHF